MAKICLITLTSFHSPELNICHPLPTGSNIMQKFGQPGANNIKIFWGSLFKWKRVNTTLQQELKHTSLNLNAVTFDFIPMNPKVIVSCAGGYPNIWISAHWDPTRREGTSLASLLLAWINRSIKVLSHWMKWFCPPWIHALWLADLHYLPMIHP